jgi:phosphoribosylamine-glycine ligase
MYACTVVCAAPGYPESYPKELPIKGVENADKLPGVKVYHAGTLVKAGELVTNGGRVLSITGVGSSLRSAIDKAYSGVNQVCFDGIHFRKDIGMRYYTMMLSNQVTCSE